MITQSITQINYPWVDRPPKNNEADFFAWGDNFTMNEIPGWSDIEKNLTTQLISLIPQINQATSDVNNISNTTAVYRDTALSYRNETLVYKSAAELAYNNTLNLTNNLVIPTAATYTYAEANKKFRTKLHQFIGLDI